MNETIIQNTLAFLERVQLNGKEVQAFNEVVNALLKELEPKEDVEEEIKEVE